jgi:flagellar transcriptional activator FlhD
MSGPISRAYSPYHAVTASRHHSPQESPLGVSEDTAKLIGALTPAQMMKIAASNTLLCRFRMDDDIVWGLLTSHGKQAANESVNRLHASILMAGRHQEAA